MQRQSMRSEIADTTGIKPDNANFVNQNENLNNKSKNTFVEQIIRKPHRRQESGLSLSDDNDSIESESNNSRTNGAFVGDSQTLSEIRTSVIKPSTTNGSKHPRLKQQLSSENGFVCQYVDGKRCEVSLNHEKFTYERSLTKANSGHNRKEIALRSIIAIVLCSCTKYSSKDIQFCDCCFPSMNVQTNKQRNALVKIFYAEENHKKGLQLNVIMLSSCLDPRAVSSDENNNQDEAALLRIFNKIHSQIRELVRPRSIKFFINPYGGKRKAQTIFNSDVKPLLDLSGVKYSSEITKKKNYAYETVLDDKFDPKQYDAIIGIGGDGLFNEIINGFLARTNNDLDDIDVVLKKSKVILGIIPAGSTDAIAICTSGFRSPMHSTLSMILGHNVDIDVTSIHNRDDSKFIRFSSCFVGYGFMGDTLQASEKNRSLGPIRYVFAGIRAFLKKRTYSCNLNLHIDPRDGSPTDTPVCKTNCPTCKRADPSLSNKSPESEENQRCLKITGDSYLGINAASMPGRCGNSKHGIAPNAHLGNGATDLILVKKCSRTKFFKFLFFTRFSRSKQLDLGCVSSYRVRKFEVIPVFETNRRGRKNSRRSNSDIDDFGTHSHSINDNKRNPRVGLWNCDGEIVNTPGIVCKVHCKAISVYGSGYPSYL